MSFGGIRRIRDDEGGKTASGELMDLETKKVYRFVSQPGLENVNKYDIVTYELVKEEAVGLVPNIKVRLENYDTAAPEVQTDVQDLLLKMAKDKNMTDVVARKI